MGTCLPRAANPSRDADGVRNVAGALVAVAGAAAWSAYNGRLLLRSLHMLQLEGYQTVRFLRWSIRRFDRWAPGERLLAGLGVVAAGVAGLTVVGRTVATSAPTVIAWVLLGAWLWRRAAPEPTKKPLALTARAKRLLGGEVAVALAVGVGPAAVLALRGGNSRERALPALLVGSAAVSLLAPPIAAGANLLLWPVEEAFRRYYLADARRVLRRHGPTVLAVAGSYGKTSTKEFLATILAARFSVLKAPGSYNTPMGLSRVIREGLQPTHELFVTELGDYVPGDIRFLCDLVSPRIGVLTTIGPEHLERFKTMENVARAKEELVEALPADGVAVVNQDDPSVRAIGDRAAARGLRVIRYGLREPGATVRATDVRTTREGLRFTVTADGRGEAEFQVGVLGRHNVANVLAATAAALELGMPLSEVAAAARSIVPVEHRLQPIQGAGGVLVIDDAFNSNPKGAAEALDVLGELEGGKKVLVTPGMIELAEREEAENRELGRKAADVCDDVILVGPERAQPILAGLRERGFPTQRTHVVRDLDEATARLHGMIGPGDVVLFENDLPDQYDR